MKKSLGHSLSKNASNFGLITEGENLTVTNELTTVNEDPIPLSMLKHNNKFLGSTQRRKNIRLTMSQEELNLIGL